MLTSCFFIGLLAILRVETRNTGETSRLFGYAYTSTEYQTKYVTTLTPSSCVYVPPSLLPCRNVRYLKFPQVAGYPFFYQPENQISATVIKSDSAAPGTTPLGWGEYFGIYAPTVTVTETMIRTDTVQDPKTVVTFALRGCKPATLPSDLATCLPEPNPFIEELAPTTTKSSSTSTALPSLIAPEPPSILPEMSESLLLNIGGTYVEPSSLTVANLLKNRGPTEPL